VRLEKVALHSADQEVLRLLRNPKFRYSVHKSPPPGPCAEAGEWSPHLPPYLRMIHCNVIFPSYKNDETIKIHEVWGVGCVCVCSLRLACTIISLPRRVVSGQDQSHASSHCEYDKFDQHRYCGQGTVKSGPSLVGYHQKRGRLKQRHPSCLEVTGECGVGRKVVEAAKRPNTAASLPSLPLSFTCNT
jgi:hypothetical protein